MRVVYLPYQELETSDGFPCTIDPVDRVDYARAHDRDSVSLWREAQFLI